jgi:hypothetical protein
MKKKISTKKKATAASKEKKSPHSGEMIDEARLNQTIKFLREARAEPEGKFLTVKFSAAEHEYMIDGLTKAKRYRRLHEENTKLKDIHYLFDEVAEYYLNMIVRSRIVASEGGDARKNLKKILKILNAPLPKLGKRPTYCDDFKLIVLEHHDRSIADFRKKNGVKKLPPEQKKEAVLAVNKEYFPMSEPDSTTQFLRRFGAEKGTLPGNRAFAGNKV